MNNKTNLISLLFFIILIPTILGYSFGCCNDDGQLELIESIDRELVCLKDTMSIHGVFGGSIFAFGGYIDGKLVINYYYRTEDGGYKSDYVNANQVTIYEDATPETARFEWRQYRKGCQYYITREMHIPKGSISNVFNLDAE